MLTSRGIDTHNKIVDTAASLFQKQSVEKTYVSQICSVAGIAKGTFYIYFETKDDLVWHFIEHRFNDLILMLDSIRDMEHTQESVYGVIDFLTEYITKNKHNLKIIHHSKFSNYLGMEYIKKRIERLMCEPVEIWLKKGMEKNIIKVTNPNFLSKFIVSGIHKLLDQVILEESDLSIKEINRLLKDNIKKLIF